MTERVITVADAAITHLKELKSKQGVDHLWLRMGVRSGGCSVRAWVWGVLRLSRRLSLFAVQLRVIDPPYLLTPPSHHPHRFRACRTCWT